MEDSHAPFWQKVIDRITEKERLRDFAVTARSRIRPSGRRRQTPSKSWG